MNHPISKFILKNKFEQHFCLKAISVNICQQIYFEMLKNILIQLNLGLLVVVVEQSHLSGRVVFNLSNFLCFRPQISKSIISRKGHFGIMAPFFEVTNNVKNQ